MRYMPGGARVCTPCVYSPPPCVVFTAPTPTIFFSSTSTITCGRLRTWVGHVRNAPPQHVIEAHGSYAHGGPKCVFCK